MHKRGKKICSTPCQQDFTSTSISTSDVPKPSSSDTSLQTNVIRRKRPATKITKGPKKKVQRKKYKRRKKDEKYTKKRSITASVPGSTWEVENVETSSDSVSLPELLPQNKRDRYQNEDIGLFQSPERVRDVGSVAGFALSPPLFTPRVNVPPIEDKIVDKLDDYVFIPEDNASHPDDKAESDNISPIFVRSKRLKTYPPAMKSTKWKNDLLINKGSGDWLVDLHMPTATADLLWKQYVQDNLNELPPQFRTSDIERDSQEDTQDLSATCSDQNGDTESTDDILSMLDRRQRKLLECKKLRRMKGSLSRKDKGKLLVVDESIVCVSDDESPSTSNARGQKERKRKWITTKDKPSYTLNDDNLDCDLRKKDGKLMTFNEFKKSKMNRNEKTSKVRVKSAVSLKSVVSKTADGNFRLNLPD